MAPVLGGVILISTLLLRLLLDIQPDTPASTALAVASALGRLLFVVGLVGVHLVYGHAYGMLGRIVVWALAIVSLVSLLGVLPAVGVVEFGSPLATVGRIGTTLSFLLVSTLGILLWLAAANRWAAGLLIILFPLGIIFGMLQAVPALTPLVGLAVGFAYIALGVDLWQQSQPQTAAAAAGDAPRSAGDRRRATTRPLRGSVPARRRRPP